jgi:hypothetical protein
VRARLALLVFGLLLAVLGVTVLARPAFAQPSTFTILLDDGTTVLAARVEPWPMEFVRATLPDGSEQMISQHKVDSIEDESGHDWTKTVLQGVKSVGEAPPQSSSPPNGPKTPTLRGMPLPWKKSFPVIQVGLLVRPDGVKAYRRDASLWAMDFGGMQNINPHYSIGGSFYLAFGDDLYHFGAKLRVRRWLGKTVSLDLAPGIFAADGYNSGNLLEPGYVGEASLSLGDWLLLTGQVEVLSRRTLTYYGGYFEPAVSIGKTTDTAWYLGGKVGGGPAIPIFLVALIATLSEVHPTRGW